MEQQASPDRVTEAPRFPAGRVFSLVAAVVAAGASAARPMPSDEAPHDLWLVSLVTGATSPFVLSLIGAVIADLVFTRRAEPRSAG